MIASTRAIIALGLVGLAAVLVVLAFVDQEGQMARVPDVLQGRSQATLIGVPQPEKVPLRGAEGMVLEPNPAYRPNVTWAKAWTQPGGPMVHSVYTLSLDGVDGATSHWSLRNATHVAGDTFNPHPTPPTVTRWTLDGYLPVLVEDFRDSDDVTPRLWSLVPASLVREPLQPKPSQFTGGLLRTLPDGTPLPDGALLWKVDDFKVGCSSKFLPPEERARLEASGDL